MSDCLGYLLIISLFLIPMYFWGFVPGLIIGGICLVFSMNRDRD